MLQVCVLPGQTLLADPVIVVGVAGGPTNANSLLPLIPRQFTVRTIKVPPVNVDENSTDTVFVP